MKNSKLPSTYRRNPRLIKASFFDATRSRAGYLFCEPRKNLAASATMRLSFGALAAPGLPTRVSRPAPCSGAVPGAPSSFTLTRLESPNIDGLMGDRALKEQALELWKAGYYQQMRGDLTRAIELYTESIEVCPTAEAYTFRGWAFRHLDRLDDAISECHRAIAIDPDFGNPYNDIGAYLMEKGDLDAAREWLEKAKLAPRYEPRHFPFMNLGRLFEAKGMITQAIKEFEAALAIEPQERFCSQSLARLRAMLN